MGVGYVFIRVLSSSLYHRVRGFIYFRSGLCRRAVENCLVLEGTT